jgi:hypothetical protein
MTWFSTIKTKIIYTSTLFLLFHESLNLVLSICMGSAFGEVVEGWVGIVGGKFVCIAIV